MEINQLHLTHPWCLWLEALIPLIWVLYFILRQTKAQDLHLYSFIDRHLLPYLLVNRVKKNSSSWQKLILWSIAWALVALALAGPRFSFREIETFAKDQSLIILLDLSESMNATDVAPSRLVRAKQKIEDLLSLSKGVKIGLIAFAADPHMISPLTDDKKNVLHLLPSLDTHLVHIQGSRLSPAFEMADTMFEAASGKNRSIVILSDGGFEDDKAYATAKKLADKGIVIHAMGVGTQQGAPMKDQQGNVIKKAGAPVMSKLEVDKFKEIARIGHGRYLEANYTDKEVTAVLKDLEDKAQAEQLVGNKDKVWDEHFYLALMPVLPIFLWWFRKGRLFSSALLFLTCLSPFQAKATDYFKNSEQLGQAAFESQDFDCAAKVFQDPYRKGVASYRKGDFAEAQEWFSQSDRPEVSCSAAYNIGNCLMQQNKLQEAVKAYEKVLEQWPDHAKAKENLDLAKKMLQEQKSEEQKQQKKPHDKPSKNDQDEQNTKNDQSSPSSQDEKEKQSEQDGQDPLDEQNNQQQEQSENQDRNNEQDKSQDQLNKEQNENEQATAETKKDDGSKSCSECQEVNAKEAKESEQDCDANIWLNRLNNDSKPFMKNKFYIESKNNGTTEGLNPW